MVEKSLTDTSSNATFLCREEKRREETMQRLSPPSPDPEPEPSSSPSSSSTGRSPDVPLSRYKSSRRWEEDVGVART